MPLRYLLNTNILSDLIRHPHGHVAQALALDLAVVTANEREFSRVPGLRVENWL